MEALLTTTDEILMDGASCYHEEVTKAIEARPSSNYTLTDPETSVQAHYTPVRGEDASTIASYLIEDLLSRIYALQDA